MDYNGTIPGGRPDRVAMESYRAATVTVAILAQGTSWAVADTQAFLPSGSIPTRVKSQSVPGYADTPLLLFWLALASCTGKVKHVAREMAWSPGWPILPNIRHVTAWML